MKEVLMAEERCNQILWTTILKWEGKT